MGAKTLNRQVARWETVKLRGIIYARVSKDPRGRMISVASQIAIGRRYFKQMGITLVKILRDNNLPASRYATQERPDHKEAFVLLENGSANLLWTWESARAQRNFSVFAELETILRQVQGFWAYNDRIYDMMDADDRLDAAEDAIEAEKEVERLRKRVRRGVESRAMRGLWAGPPTYGFQVIYDVKTGEALRREKHPEQAPAAREIVLRLTALESPSVIGRDLDRRGIKPLGTERWRSTHVDKIGKFNRDPIGWAKLVDSLTSDQVASAELALQLLNQGESSSSAARILNSAEAVHVFPGKWDQKKLTSVATNPAIAGLRVFHGEIIGRGKWPRIITLKERARLLAVVGDPTRRNVKDGGRTLYFQTGISVCDTCNKTTTSRKKRQGYDGPIYRCPGGHFVIDMDQADAFVVTALLNRLERPDAAELFRVVAADDDRGKAAAEAMELRDRLNALTDEAAAGKLTTAQLVRFTGQLVPQIAAAEARAKAAGVDPLLAELIGPQARQVWAELDPVQQRAVLRAVAVPRLIPVGEAKINRWNAMLEGNGSAEDTAGVVRVTMSWLSTPVPLPPVDPALVPSLDLDSEGDDDGDEYGHAPLEPVNLDDLSDDDWDDELSRQHTAA